MAGNTVTVNILGDASDIKAALGQAQSSLEQFQAKARSVGQQATSIGRSMTIGLTLPIVGAFKVANDELTQSARATAQTAAVIKSTGGAAHVTATQVDELAQSLLKKTGIDDEQIKAGENMLLTFRGIRNEAGKGNDIFTQATKVTTDLSVAMGKDMASSAILVGKALNDPIKGLTALQRVGIQFNAHQRELIQGFMDQGDTMSAQKVILKELTAEFGGSGEAIGNTFAGQLSKAREELKNSMAAILSTAIPVMQKLAEWGLAAARAFEDLPAPVKEVGVVIAALVAAAGPVTYIFGAIAKAVSGTISIFQSVASASETVALKFLYLQDAVSLSGLALSGGLVIGLAAAGIGLGKLFASLDTSKGYFDRLDATTKQWAEHTVLSAKASGDEYRALSTTVGALKARVADLRAQYPELENNLARTNLAVGQGSAATVEAARAYSQAKARIEALSPKLAELKQQQAEAAAQNAATKQSIDAVASGTTDWKHALDGAKQALIDLQSTVLAQQGGMLGLQQANINVTKAQYEYNAALAQYGPDSIKTKEAEIALQQARLQVASATDNAANSQDKLTQDVGKHGEKIPALVAKLRDEQATYGDTNGVIQEQIDKLFWLWLSKQKVPGDVGFTVNANVGQALEAIAEVNAGLDAAANRVVNTTINVIKKEFSG